MEIAQNRDELLQIPQIIFYKKKDDNDMHM